MEGQDYLNQISAKTRPVKKEKKGIFSSKFFWVGAIGCTLLLVIIILGAILGSNKGGEKSNTISLQLHVNATSEVIKTYQPNLKSSILRSESASLQSVLVDTDNKLSDYLKNKYDYKNSKADKKMTAKADSDKSALEGELFKAKINGYLDRVFAHKMAYEISIIMTEEEKLDKIAKDDSLKEIIKQSYDSLENLYNKFNDFSEAK